MAIRAIRRRRVRQITAAALVLFAVGAASCGSDGTTVGDEPVDTEAPSDTITPPAETAPPGTTSPTTTSPSTAPPATEPPNSEPPSTEPPTSDPVTSEPATSEPTTPRGSAAVERAIDDMAARRGVARSEIFVITTEDVTWRDGSIGCPQKDMAYTQALVPGTRIVLEAAGIRDVYHSGDGGDPFYCATPVEPLDSAGGTSADI